MQPDFTDSALRPLLLQGEFGLEKESLRVNENGRLAQTPHPFPEDPQIDRDFCENQVELITTVCDSPAQVYQQLSEMTSRVQKKLRTLPTGPEYLWPFSNPPYVAGEAEISIAVYSREQAAKRTYREYLAQKYGKRKMLYSGIHFNFSFPKSLLHLLPDPSQTGINNLYLDLAEKAVHYTWLMVVLTAASPLCDRSFFQEGQQGDTFRELASLRCSQLGYWNNFVPHLRYETLQAYCDSVQKYLEQGTLQAFSELYLPIRLKPAGENTLENLRNYGISHLELRMLDLNPLDPCGIDLRDLEFLHYFLLWLTSIPQLPTDAAIQEQAIRNHKLAAAFDPADVILTLPGGEQVPLLQQGLKVLHQMSGFFRQLHLSQAEPILQFQRDKLLHPEHRYAPQVLAKFSGTYLEKGLTLAKSTTLT